MILSDAASTIELQSAAILEHIGLNTVGTKSAILRETTIACVTLSHIRKQNLVNKEACNHVGCVPRPEGPHQNQFMHHRLDDISPPLLCVGDVHASLQPDCHHSPVRWKPH